MLAAVQIIILIMFDVPIPPKVHELKAWSPEQIVITYVAFGTWLDRKGSDFINGLIYWSVHHWWHY